MYSRFLSADADGFLGSTTIQEEDLAGLTLRNQANWDAKDEWDEDEEEEEEGWDEEEDEEDWDEEDFDEGDDGDDEDWDDDDEEEDWDG